MQKAGKDALMSTQTLRGKPELTFYFASVSDIPEGGLLSANIIDGDVKIKCFIGFDGKQEVDAMALPLSKQGARVFTARRSVAPPAPPPPARNAGPQGAANALLALTGFPTVAAATAAAITDFVGDAAPAVPAAPPTAAGKKRTRSPDPTGEPPAKRKRAA
jgi:hypothetical protein